MTARERIDSLSGTLLCDERILSVPERELLANLLQRTRTQVSAADNGVAEAITRTVGEIIAERALSVLGESLTRQLLQQQLGSSVSFPNRSLPAIRAGTPPMSPPSPSPGGNQPRPPGTSPPSISAGSPPVTPPSPGQNQPRPPGTSPPSISAGSPPVTPPSPGQNQPRPPGTSPPPISRSIATSQPKTGGVAVLESPDYLAAKFVVLDEFLTLAELNRLNQYVIAQETRFEISEVLSPGVTAGAVDYEHRRSRVLMDLGGEERVIVDRLLAFLPRILEKWGRDPFPISRVETQITASNHGDFFHCHVDNGADAVAGRDITFVYFFHHEPKPFRGGELRIFDSRRENDIYVPTANYRTIVPEQNQLILFASGLSHEITPVECPSAAFADSRFTINGWVHR
jgi:Rps23 Pro-64 3,4-dihydroxylase Tpa1-like proline 4-hydroxylase